MNKFLMGVAATALILSSCAQNDLMDGPNKTPNDGKIRFAASTGLNTKGTPFNSTGDLQTLGVFSVRGFVNGAGADLINSNMQWQPATSTWEYEVGRDIPYWPQAWMDFYAFANWQNVNVQPLIDPAETEGIKAAGVAIGQDVNGSQEDLLVAITPNANKELRTLLNFKHALTQIVFKAGVVNDKIDVTIGGISLVNIASVGDMSFNKNDSKIQWVNQATPVDYVVGQINGTFANAFAVPQRTVGAYSTFPRVQTAPDPNNNSLMLVPQTFNAWDPTSGVFADASTDAYIKLTVCVRKAGIAATAGNEHLVYAGGINAGEFTFQDVYIPVESNLNQAGLWEPGKRINYIFSFGDNDSGSGGAGYDEEGNPILVPIKFRAVVEDWTEVNVPVLTATVSAQSNAITHEFINGFTNQLLNDIKGAPAPKVIAAKINFSGFTSTNIASTLDSANAQTQVTFDDLLLAATKAQQNTKFLPGSTLTFDFTAVDFANGNATLSIPDGWTAKYGSGTDVAFGSTAVLDGTENRLVLTKYPVAGYDFVTIVNYLQDNLNALEINENGYSTTPACGNTIYVNGVVNATNSTHFTYSSEAIGKLVSAPIGSTVTVNMTNVNFTSTTPSNDATTWCPAGWQAVVTGAPTVIYYAGEPIMLSAPDVITFTRIAGTNVFTYRNHINLLDWLASAPTAGAIFYYDNVDFDVEINDATLAGSTATTGAVIQLKYPVSTGKMTATGWDYNGVTGELTKQ